MSPEWGFMTVELAKTGDLLEVHAESMGAYQQPHSTGPFSFLACFDRWEEKRALGKRLVLVKGK